MAHSNLLHLKGLEDNMREADGVVWELHYDVVDGWTGPADIWHNSRLTWVCQLKLPFSIELSSAWATQSLTKVGI